MSGVLLSLSDLDDLLFRRDKCVTPTAGMWMLVRT